MDCMTRRNLIQSIGAAFGIVMSALSKPFVPRQDKLSSGLVWCSHRYVSNQLTTDRVCARCLRVQTIEERYGIVMRSPPTNVGPMAVTDRAVDVRLPNPSNYDRSKVLEVVKPFFA